MSIRNCVLIFGKSLNLAGLGACLKQDESLDVQFLDPKDPNVEKCVSELNPEAIIFDLSDLLDNLELALLRNRPGLVLIGVDPSSDDVLILSGKRSRVVTSVDLAQVISNQIVKISNKEVD
jgi:hypothetical protein